MRTTLFAAIVFAASTIHAFDFGSVVQAVTPVAQSAAPAVDTSLASNPLITNLTSTLGVTPTQAIGGTAAVLYDAKSSMTATDYKSLTQQVPQVSSLMSAVPSSFLKTGTTASQFSMLGMDASMVDKFSPLVLEYLQSGATPGMDRILSAAFAK